MSREDLEAFCTPTSKHVEFRDRVRKTLYYGQYSDRSLPSLALTDVAVDVIGSVATTKSQHLDTNYALAVSRRAKISPCTLMMGILYSERLRQKNPEYLRKVSSSDLFLISMMVASKYLYDEGEDEEVFNDDWARAGSKTVNYVNKLEMEFLASIDWSLFISNEDFLDFVNKVESRVATTHGLCRGWFTYGDLCTLLDNLCFLRTLSTIRIEVLKVVCVCAVAYVFSLSLALSALTMLANHHSRHTHHRLVPEHVTLCLTTESTCRLHRPTSIKIIFPKYRHLRGTLVAGKAAKGLQNKSQISVQSQTSLKRNLLEDRAVLFEEMNARLAPGKTETVSQLSSHWQFMSNRSQSLTTKPTNVISVSEAVSCRCTPGLSNSQYGLLSGILSRKHLLQQSLSTCSMNGVVTSPAPNDVSFSNFSQGSRNNNHQLSYICVA